MRVRLTLEWTAAPLFIQSSIQRRASLDALRETAKSSSFAPPGQHDVVRLQVAVDVPARAASTVWAAVSRRQLTDQSKGPPCACKKSQPVRSKEKRRAAGLGPCVRLPQPSAARRSLTFQEGRIAVASPGSRLDPRYYQIAVLASLLTYGLVWLDFEIAVGRAALILATVLFVQYVCTRLWNVRPKPGARRIRYDPRSALISGLSLCLLLRTNFPELAILAAIVTIASKFVLRIDGKHIFNPTNFGLVAAMLATGQVWVSPGQWGSAAFFGFLMACLGGLVVNRAARSDATFAFLAFYGALVFGRSWWLGEPMAIPAHRLESGAFLLFSFFMISDPKTTPDSRAGRVLFAFLVAVGAWYVQFRLFRTNGLLWSLAIFSLVVPLIDRLLPGRKYEWQPGVPIQPQTDQGTEAFGQGESHEPHSSPTVSPVAVLSGVRRALFQ